MPRAPYQILVIPFRITSDGILYALLQRRDNGVWQGIAGGGEEGEAPEEAARRETFEESGIPGDARLIPLDSTVSIPAIHFQDRHAWGSNRYVIPEYSFGIESPREDLELSEEHTTFLWLPYEEASRLLHFDSNKTALWELNQRLTNP